MQQYQGKKVVIIGGTSGMGLATAKMLLDGGARVLVTGRSQAGLESAQKELGKVPCNECLYKSSNMQEYGLHLAKAHQYSRRKVKAAVTQSLRRHSICRDCWNKHYARISS